MIYASGLRAEAKSAYPSKVYQTKIAVIVKNSLLDPTVSGMEAALLSSDDFKGINSKFMSNLAKAHPKCVLIYIYTKDSEARDIPKNFKPYKVKKITPDEIRAAVEEFLSLESVGDNITRTLNSVDNRERSKEEVSTIKKKGLFGLGKRTRMEATSRDSNIQRSKEQSEMISRVLADDGEPRTDVKVVNRKIDFKVEDDSKISDSTAKFKRNTESVDNSQVNRGNVSKESISNVNTMSSNSYENSYTNGVNEDNEINEVDMSEEIQAEEKSSSREEVVKDTSISRNNADVEKVELTGNSRSIEETMLIQSNKRSTVQNYEERLTENAKKLDIDTLARDLELESITSNLLYERSDYVAIEDALKSLDMEMMIVTRDSTMTAEDMLLKIRQLARVRTEKMEKKNAIIASKLQSIITTVVEATERSSKEKIEETRRALEVLKNTDAISMRIEEINKITRKRTEMQLLVQESVSSVVAIYSNLNKTATDVRNNMLENVPSSNPLINNLLAASNELYTPSNIADLWTQVCKGLQDGRITLSAVETELRSLILTIGELFKRDSEIIEKRTELTSLLSAKNVEQIIVPKNTLQTAVRVIVGPRNSGVTMTGLTLSGIASASNSNVLLMDMRVKPKINNYIETIGILDLFQQRDPLHLCGVVGIPEFHLAIDEESKKELFDEFVSELEMSLNGYRYINIIIDDTQLDLLEELSEYVLSINFLTDSSPENIDIMKEFISKVKFGNMAKKIVIVDPAIDPLDLFMQLSDGNPILYGLNVVPYISSMKKCTLRKLKPYEDDTIVTIFREAFTC